MLSSFLEACDRVGLSDHGAALLEDVGMVAQKDSLKIIDRNKVQRAKQSYRHNLPKEAHGKVLVTGICYDGRNDKTLTIQKIGDRDYRRKVVEERIALVSQPGSLILYQLKCNEITSFQMLNGNGAPAKFL